MNTPNESPRDERLGALLRESRPTSCLPPRFQESVWRRIEKAESEHLPVSGPNWLDALAARVLKPGFALAAATALVLAGVLFGTIEGATQARQQAQARYLATVAPEVVH